jgi:zinc protease
VIISELQGGENDPEQLLEQELTATAFRAHSYRHPTIGWLSDLQTMTRDDLFEYYRRFYVPNNATLVIVGDVDTDDALRRAAQHFSGFTATEVQRRPSTAEPEQLGERRVTVAKEGTTAYLKVGFHAPGVSDPGFFPMLVLDAVLTGAKGLNIWASFRTPPPQRSARLYRALVDTSLASSVQGALLPTQQPFLYTISATATDGTSLDAVEQRLLAELDRVRRDGVTLAELERARHQLRARLVFEGDSISNIAHQLGYFETVANWGVYAGLRDHIEQVTLDQVNAIAALFRDANRTVARFDPAAALEGGR